jgi:nitrogenase molybdenum-iron protein alpha/beta subunit
VSLDPDDELPERYTSARVADEPFWLAQEKRVQGSAGQPCCSLSGISTGLMALRGRFAVIVHGEDECSACFYHTGPSAPQFFCTGLTEQNFVLGETREPLVRCLRAVASEMKPEAIFVLGACPIEVIGDRFEVVVSEINAEFPSIPMVALHTHGLKVGSQAAMLDWMFSTLASLPSKTARVEGPTKPRYAEALMSVAKFFVDRESDHLDKASKHFRGELLQHERSLNLLGYPRGRYGQALEIETLLAQIGEFKVTSLPGHGTLGDWRNAKEAQVTFAFDTLMYPKLIEVLAARGQRVESVDIPVGIEATEAFYLAVARGFGVEDQMRSLIAEPMAKAKVELAAFKAKWGGKRLAMGLRLGNNYHADHVGRMGLGDYQFFRECGFEITLMVQGAPEKSGTFEKFFKTNGVDRPFVMFPEPWTLSQWIDGGRFDIGCFLDHCRGEVNKAGVSFVAQREFDAGFAGMTPNLRYLERALQQSHGQGA